MKPVLFDIFGFAIHSYGVMLAVAFIAAIAVASRHAKRLGENPDHIGNMAVWVVILAMIGARLFHCAVFWREYVERPLMIFNVREGGLVFYGGFIGGVIGAMIYFHRHNLDKLLYADIVAPTVALGLGFARIGCFLAGCCHGKACPAEYPFAVTFPPETIGIPGIPLYPTQLAESVLSFGVFAILTWIVWPRRRYAGQVIAWFLVLYGAMRGFLEFFRADPRGFATLFHFSGEPGRVAETSTGLWKALLWSEAVIETSAGTYAFRVSESQLVGLVLFAVAAVMFVVLPRKRPVDKITEPEPIETNRKPLPKKKRA
ncbi:prolipoprotein diacylglyceryl transferase [bacterium]|nr:prolipoprotein diacylglyceryl transferase [bacterium]